MRKGTKISTLKIIKFNELTVKWVLSTKMLRNDIQLSFDYVLSKSK